MIKTGSELSIARQAKLLNVSRSSVYYRPKPESKEELDLLKRLDEIFTENPMYGSRRLQVMLKREGIQVGRRRVRNLMRKLGLWAVGPKPNTRGTTTGDRPRFSALDANWRTKNRGSFDSRAKRSILRWSAWARSIQG